MKKRVSVLFIGLLLLCSAVAYADIINPVTFTVTPESVKDKIPDLQKDSAEFYVTVENKGELPDTFKLLLFEDPKWSFQLLPNPNEREMKIAAGGNAKFHMLVKGANIKDGTYSVKAWVQSSTTGNKNYGILKIQIGEPQAPKTPPNPDFDVDVTVPSQMDPRGSYTVVVNIKNNNELLLDSINIKLSSNLVNDDTNVTVNPNESKSVSFAVLLMENIQPQGDQLHVSVDYKGKSFYEEDHNFEVVSYTLPFKTDIAVVKKFLREERTITVTNDANSAKSDTMRIETSLKERFFSSSVPKFKTLKENGKYYLTWPVTLEPEQSKEIKLVTSYRILLLVALILIILLGYKAATSNQIIVKKKIANVKKSHGGAITELSVVVLLKNRGNEAVSKIRVFELIPGIVRLKQESFEGSMHPVKMHSQGSGTLLEYRFAEIAPGDERIIRYRVFSKLDIFGDVTIKPTKVEFATKKGATKKSRSRTVSMHAEEPQGTARRTDRPEQRVKKEETHKPAHAATHQQHAQQQAHQFRTYK